MADKKLNGEKQARLNELEFLKVVRQQGQIRADELALLLQWSKEMTLRTARRLRVEKQIVAVRKYSSYFYELGADNKTTFKIRTTWKHDCLAIQCLCFLNKELTNNTAQVKTEAEIRMKKQDGKICDGQIIKGNEMAQIEVELSHKSGNPMRKAALHAVRLANEKITVLFCYPAETNEFQPFDWNKILRSYIRHELQHDNPFEHIKFLEFSFADKNRVFNPLAWSHCRPSSFKIRAFGKAPESSMVGKNQQTIGTEQVQGCSWRTTFKGKEASGKCLIAELSFDNWYAMTYKFFSGTGGHEIYERDDKDNWLWSDAYLQSSALETFDQFVEDCKANAEKLLIRARADAFA